MYLPRRRKSTDNHITLLYGLDGLTSLDNLTGHLMAHDDTLIRRLNPTECMKVTGIGLVSDIASMATDLYGTSPKPNDHGELLNCSEMLAIHMLLTSHTAQYTSLSQ